MSTDSLKRIARTGLQALIALGTITPVLLTVLSGTPAEAKVAIFAGWVTAVTAIVNKLEDAFPSLALLKDDAAQSSDGMAMVQTAAARAQAWLDAHPDAVTEARADLAAAASALGVTVDAKASRAAIVASIQALAAPTTPVTG
jgi:hypothetical protein